MTKACRGCGQVKSLSAFGREARTKDGLRARCKSCRSGESAAWRDANREHLKAYDQEAAQRRKEYQREWRFANPERVRAYKRASPSTRRDFLTQWRKQHGSPIPAGTEAP